MEDAVRIWTEIPPDRLHGIPAIGIRLQELENDLEAYIEADILTARGLDLETLSYYLELA